MTFSFVADRPVLDFVATVSERGTTHDDALLTPADLAAWVAQSGLTDDEITVEEDRFGDAKAVREALFALIASLIDRTQPRPEDRALVNRAAAEAPPVVQLDDSGRTVHHGGLEAVLALLARDCLELFGSDDRLLLHWCAADRCTRPFLDRSRGSRRRWCEMKSCGDRVKAAAYRRRRRSPAQGGR